MIKSALEFITSLARPLIVTAEGRSYTADRLTLLTEPALAEARTLHVNSLRGLVDYALAQHDEHHQATDGDEWSHGIAAAHVVDPRRVELISWHFGKERQRETYAIATPPDGDKFPFGKFLPPADFLIRCLALFQQSGDMPAVLEVVGNLRDDAVRTLADDGVTQIATVRQGVNRASSVEIRNPVTLQPFRTFADVEQPMGRFVLRLAGGGDSGPPTVALFEVDDSQWRREAIDNVRAYLVEHLPEVPVIA